MNFLNYMAANWPQIWARFMEHLSLTFAAVAIAVVVGIPLGILINYVRRLYRPVMAFANLVQAVPSLALLGFLIPILGIGSLPGICMVVVYSLLPIIKNTATGLGNINPETVEAAKGIGLTKMQVLMRVKLPLALPVIMAGIRISAVTAVGLMTLAALIGAGGLGYLIYSGIRMVNTNLILAGAIPACFLALFIDFMAAMVENAVTPIGSRPDAKTFDKKKIQRFKTTRKAILAGAGLVTLLAIGSGLHGSMAKGQKTMTIGSKDFTEQVILGHIFSELVEGRTDIKVVRMLDLGGTSVAFGALKAGELDMYVEYDGTVYSTIMRQDGGPAGLSAAEVYPAVKDYLAKKHGLDYLEPLGFNNTYTLSVPPEIAAKYNLKTISDLAMVAPELVAGTGMEFLNRDDGLPGLSKKYGINFRETVAVETGLPKYIALMGGQTNVTDAFSTDGMLIKYNLTVLQDDKSFFPPYNAAPLVRPAILQKYPELEAVLNLLAGKLNDDVMRNLNYLVDIEQQGSREVAREFLVKQGLIKPRAD